LLHIPWDKPQKSSVKQDVLSESLGFFSGPMAVSVLLASGVALQGDCYPMLGDKEMKQSSSFRE
jgi:hypothetical protein